MKERILQFIEVLRSAGLQPSLAESLDALAAAAAAGVSRSNLRGALAATLVKEEADRPAFDRAFDSYFAYRAASPRKRPRLQTSGPGNGSGGGEDGGSALARRQPEEEPGSATPTQRESERPGTTPGKRKSSSTAERMAQLQALTRRAFQDMDAHEQAQCVGLAEALARRFHANLARRLQRHKRGHLDVRTTLRRSIRTGGVPIDPAFRRRRPGRMDLVVLCDCSHSVATASRFLLSLINPCQAFFRRVHLFAFVDREVPVSLEQGHLVPHEALDLYARSDFGATLVGFLSRRGLLLNRNTVVLILGDARNNRRPARADVLAKIAASVRHLAWLNPEPISRWNSGDSAMASYAPHCGTLVAASTPRTLSKALGRLLIA